MQNSPYVAGNGLNTFETLLPTSVAPLPPLMGTGSPEGAVAANPGTTYTDVSDPTNLWVKIAGVQTVGWKKIPAIVNGTPGNTPSGGGIPTAFGTIAQRDAFTPSTPYFVWFLTDSVPPYMISIWANGQWN